MKHISEIDTFLTEQIKGQEQSWTCPECGGTDTQYRLQIINTGRPDNYFPRWIPQIKESCANCGRYRRFAPQTDVLIDRFNQRLETINLKAKGERDV